jgi:hypothetical protein
VTDCAIGIATTLDADLLVERVVVEGNEIGVARLGGSLHLLDSIVRGNSHVGPNSNLLGAGVWCQGTFEDDGLLLIERSAIVDNEAGFGAGLLLEALARAVVVDSTISGNRAAQDGAGIHASLGSELELASSTVAFNEADFDDNGTGIGGGLHLSADVLVTLRNSAISDNTAAGPMVTGWDCLAPVGVILSQGHNLIHRTLGCQGVIGDPTNVLEQSADLLSLANNGGPTPTHAPLAGSPIVEMGNPTGCAYDGDFSPGTPLVQLAVDQRGADRHADGNDDGQAPCDIGAYELLPADIFSDGFESGDTSAWDSTVQ